MFILEKDKIYKKWETFQSYEKFSWIKIDRTRNIRVFTER